MMLPPIFILDAAAAMNYGGFGQIVGHEMMHAYDVRGIKLTHEGRSAKYNATDTLQEYERKVLCLRASYQKAEDSRARTLDQTIDAEGFADYTGILLAHEAFRRLADDQRTRTVPDVGLTADQAFFVAHCIKWCNADKVNKTRPFRGAYWHSRSRCIVPLQNMPEFAQAFSCRHGDYMNPDNRCDFW
ncbi:neprilysin-3-like [Amblyomma americanum]